MQNNPKKWLMYDNNIIILSHVTVSSKLIGLKHFLDYKISLKNLWYNKLK